MTRVDDHDRFGDLAAVVTEPVRRYLVRRADVDTAEEVVSETLLVCWRRMDEIPADAATAWAIGVARMCLSNAQRSQRRQWRLTSKIARIDPPPVVAVTPDASDSDASGVSAALTQLPRGDAEILRLWAWEHLSVAEIALVLEITANSAGVRLHRAKKKLRAVLEVDPS